MEEIKGDGEFFWRNEKVRSPGDLSNSKLFLRG
jgi:hypothetical protein